MNKIKQVIEKELEPKGWSIECLTDTYINIRRKSLQIEFKTEAERKTVCFTSLGSRQYSIELTFDCVKSLFKIFNLLEV